MHCIEFSQLPETPSIGCNRASQLEMWASIMIQCDSRAMCQIQHLDSSSGFSTSSRNSNCSMDLLEIKIKLLYNIYDILKKQVVQLQAMKLYHTDLEKLCLLLHEGGQESIATMLDDLQGQASSCQTKARETKDCMP
ncbi:uncharacterized protein AAGF69_004444 isoform 1-T1 [Amazona ochrocephala]